MVARKPPGISKAGETADEIKEGIEKNVAKRDLKLKIPLGKIKRSQEKRAIPSQNEI